MSDPKPFIVPTQRHRAGLARTAPLDSAPLWIRFRGRVNGKWEPWIYCFWTDRLTWIEKWVREYFAGLPHEIERLARRRPLTICREPFNSYDGVELYVERF